MTPDELTGATTSRVLVNASISRHWHKRNVFLSPARSMGGRAPDPRPGPDYQLEDHAGCLPRKASRMGEVIGAPGTRSDVGCEHVAQKRAGARCKDPRCRTASDRRHELALESTVDTGQV